MERHVRDPSRRFNPDLTALSEKVLRICVFRLKEGCREQNQCFRLGVRKQKLVKTRKFQRVGK